MSESMGHDLTLRDREQTCDLESDAAGMIAYAIKSSVGLVAEVECDDEVLAEVGVDYVMFRFPSTTVRVKRERYADQMAKEAADGQFCFWSAVFSRLRS